MSERKIQTSTTEIDHTISTINTNVLLKLITQFCTCRTKKTIKLLRKITTTTIWTITSKRDHTLVESTIEEYEEDNID